MDKTIEEQEYDIVKSHFPVDYRGVVIDIGANEPIFQNNSYKLEQEGWDCYCVEPNPRWTDELKKIRKNVYPIAIGETNNDSVDFFRCHAHENEAAGSGLSYMPDFDQYKVDKIHVPLRTFEWFLSNEVKKQPDVIFIDVEWAEMKVLSNLDTNKWKPKLIFIENIEEYHLQRIWFYERGYQRITRIGLDDVYLRGEK